MRFPLLRAGLGLTWLLAASSTPALAFDFDDVARRAQALATKPYQNPANNMPSALRELSYDQFRDIRFKTERSLWRGSKLPFELQFFHPGLYYTQPVRINLVTADGVRPLPFDPDDFDYGKNELERDQLRDIGYAGLRVHYPLNSERYKDELVVFLGASYFRALGEGQLYGLSARGLAVDTAMLSGEEFPHFNEFWIEWPRAEDRELTIYALLDSRRVSGAYRFQIKPGASTRMDVQTRLYLREGVGKLGIAPLTSMFFSGENQLSRNDDFRPEVHDSDGLMLQTDQEWLWRPLSNPRRLLVTSFAAVNPRGFGMMQRDRNFHSYEDLETRYDLRPSAWVTPRGDWGKGRVELVQIPTPDETNDNIVAFWVPEALPAPGTPLDFSYELDWQMKAETQPPLARVAQTRRGAGYVRERDNSIWLHVDFEGGPLTKLPADAMVIASITVGETAELLERQIVRNPVSGGWRTHLRIRRPDPEKPVEMRVNLRHGQDIVSETWSYILPGEPE